MKAKLQAKLRSRKGFTLVEMLIVVAIIAILVAISIPVVSSSLEKARVATDQANERAAKAVALIAYLTEETDFQTGTKYTYDAEKGVLNIGAGGASTADTAPTTTYGQCSDHDGGYITVSVSAEGDVTVEWAGTGVDNTNPHNLDGSVDPTT